MCTALFSREGKYRAIVKEFPDKETDKYLYQVDATHKIFDSQRKAIRNARRWLKKKRGKYYKKHPKKWTKRQRKYPVVGTEVKRPNPIKTLLKIYVMNKQAAAIILKYSNEKLKLHKKYAAKRYGKKFRGVSGSTDDFNLTIAKILEKGKPKERKIIAKMLMKFTLTKFRKTNMFY